MIIDIFCDLVCVDLMFQEKAPFVAAAERKKADYDKSILAYNKKLVNTFLPYATFLIL